MYVCVKINDDEGCWGSKGGIKASNIKAAFEPTHPDKPVSVAVIASSLSNCRSTAIHYKTRERNSIDPKAQIIPNPVPALPHHAVHSPLIHGARI